MATEAKVGVGPGGAASAADTAMAGSGADNHATARSFWRILTSFDRAKLMPYRALRNTAGVVLPLAVGYALGMPRGGVAVASGALNVAYSDGADPYDLRAKRMLASSVLCALGVFTGALTGQHSLIAVPLTMMWAFLAGLSVAISPQASDLGVISLVLYLIYSAQRLTPREAAIAGGLALGGGLLQTLLSLALWPVQRYHPERRALAAFYRELASLARATLEPGGTPTGGAEGTQAQQALSGLSRDATLEGVRYRSLLTQGERIRLGLVVLARLLRRMEREGNAQLAVEIVQGFLKGGAEALEAVSDSLQDAKAARGEAPDLAALKSLPRELRRIVPGARTSFLAAVAEDARFQMDALTGQLQAALELAGHATEEGQSEFAKQEAHQPWQLRFTGRLATLRANLHWGSAAFRHAVRLAVCVGLGDVLTRSIPWERSYWLPMTIVLVLKPEFTVTFSRGVLRIAGTVVGLLLATALFHYLPIAGVISILLAAIFMFFLRWVGAANYGIFGVAISALIVLLIAITGLPPMRVIWARGLNTAAGGALALVAYWVWPTWESMGIAKRIQQMLRGYRDYFHDVAQSYMERQGEQRRELDRTRVAARMARSNLEASIDRLSAEPGTTASDMNRLNAMLASSQRFLYAIMALEAGLHGRTAPVRPAFPAFADDVEKTLELMSKALDGHRVPAKDLPDLREDQIRLVQSGEVPTERYALVNVESDRITNSLNTLREQVLELARGDKGPARPQKASGDMIRAGKR